MNKIVASALPFLLTLTVVAFPRLAHGGQKTDVQKVRLEVVDDRYLVTPSRVTKGVPVRMDVDVESVKGCAGTVVISAFGVRKTIKKDDATITFTPDKTGTVEIACGMNMVKGTLVVTAH
jgi:plastocyanin domain-containing protein